MNLKLLFGSSLRIIAQVSFYIFMILDKKVSDVFSFQGEELSITLERWRIVPYILYIKWIYLLSLIRIISKRVVWILVNLSTTSTLPQKK